MALWLLLSGGAAFLATWLLTPRIAEFMFSRGFKGRDLHREYKVEIPEQGGVSVVGGFYVGLLVFALGSGGGKELLFPALSALLVASLGYYDRIKRLSAREKAIGLMVASLPLMPVAEPTLMDMHLGAAYYLALPVLFMFTCNFTNMLAGLNGLEVGVGAIASLGIATLAYLQGSEIATALALILALSLLAFLRYNFYPARVFPGDVGTLFIGALLFSSAIVGKFELLGIIVLLPYVIDAALKLISAGVMVRESQEPTRVKGGKLYPPGDSNLSLVRAILKVRSLGERDTVVVAYGIVLLFSFLAITLEILLP